MTSENEQTHGRFSMLGSDGRQSPTEVSKSLHARLTSGRSGNLSQSMAPRQISYPPRVPGGRNQTPETYDPHQYKDKRGDISCEIEPTDASAADKCCTVTIKFEYMTDQGLIKTPEKLEYKASVHDYMTWKYFVNSQTQIKKCTDYFKSVKVIIDISAECLRVEYPLNCGKDCKELLKDVICYAVSNLKDTLTIKNVDVNKTCLKLLSKDLYPEIVAAEEIHGQVFIAFQTISQEAVFELLKRYMNNRKESEQIQINPALRHFKRQIIDTLLSDSGVADADFDWKGNCYYCTVKDSTLESREITRRLLKEKENDLFQKDVTFSTYIISVLKSFSFQDQIRSLLKKAYPDCVAEQREHLIIIYGFDEKKVKKAAQYIGESITEDHFLLAGNDLRQKRDDILKYIRDKYENMVFAVVNSGFMLDMVGLKSYLHAIKAHLVEVREGRISLDAGLLQRTVTTDFLVVKEEDSSHLNHCNRSQGEQASVDEDIKSSEGLRSESVFEETAAAARPQEDHKRPTETLRNINHELFKKDHALTKAGMKSGRTLEQVVQTYRFSDSAHAIFMEKFSIFEDISQACGVRLQHDTQTNTINVRGQEVDVRKALQSIENYVKSLVTHEVCILEDQALNHFKMSRKKTQLHKEARSNRTIIKENTHTLWTCDQIKVSEMQEVNTCEWSYSENKRLVLIHRVFEEITAPWKFVFVLGDPKEGKRFADKKTHFEVALDDCTGDRQADIARFKETIRSLLDKLKEDRAVSAALMLNPAGNWLFEDMTTAAANIFVRWLLTDRPMKLKKVILCVSSQEQICKAHDALQGSLTELLECKIKVLRLSPSVCQGLLHEETADVLINTTTSSLNLSQGQVSKALSTAAGVQLQEECRRNYPRGIYGEKIADTAGYNLRCQRVYHISLPVFTKHQEADCYKSVKTLVVKCLTKASEGGYTSIAFPVIGTGGLGYPKDFVPALMFTSVEKFKAEALESSLDTIKFVVYTTEASLFKEFCTQGESLATKQGQSKLEKVSEMTLTVIGKEEDVKKTVSYIEQMKKERTAKQEDVSEAVTSNSPAATFRPRSEEYQKMSEYRLQNFTIKVCNGNILLSKAECFVNAANEHLSHSGGIAECIAKAAGREVLDESAAVIKKRGPLKVGDVVRTNPGNLECKHLLHAVGPRFGDPVTAASLRECQDALKNTVLKCLQEAEALRCRSVALPTISSGIFAVPIEICAEQYALALLEFYPKSSSLHEVIFFDINEKAISKIDLTFSAMITEREKSPWDTDKYITRDMGNQKTKLTARDRPQNNADQNIEQAFAKVLNRGTQQVVQFGRKCEVQVYNADIFCIGFMDCIVCQAGKNGEPVGQIAQQLLKEGGKKYEHDKKTQIKARKVADAVLTGGTSQFDHVLHTVVSKEKKDLERMYKNIFTEICNNSSLQLVCLPILGVDETDDLASVTRVIYKELFRCCRGANRTSRLALHIVAPQDVAARAVDKELQNCVHELNKSDGAMSMSSLVRQADYVCSEDVTAAETKDDNKMSESENCVICMDTVKEPHRLKCGHVFCKECIERYFHVKKVCPTCGQVCGTISGDQPDGTMEVRKSYLRLPGYEDHRTIIVTYKFRDGIQGPEHTHPGTSYRGISRTAYLPDNVEGREICAMLIVAFERRLVFTIGRSRTTGKEGVITWNDIHHKTDHRPNTQFGFPDPTYLQRVRDELKVKGVTNDDITSALLTELQKDSLYKVFRTDSTIY